MKWFPFLKRHHKPAVFGLALGSGGAKGMAHLGALKAFEEAIALVKLCNSRLENAEQQVRILTEGADGVVSDAPFFKEDEN